MNQNPNGRNNDRYQGTQRGGNGANSGRGQGYNMTPEERQEYLRRMEAQRRRQAQGGERPSHRRRKRKKINLGLTLFLVIICIVVGVSLYQISKNALDPSFGNKDPNPGVVETGKAGEVGDPAGETDGAGETEPPETDAPETDLSALFDTYAVNSADINLGDLILVNYQHAYSLTDTVALKTMYGAKSTSYSLSNSSHKLTERVLGAMDKFADGFAAATGCYELVVNSAYRNLVDQQNIYEDYVNRGGEEYAKMYVANPGYSEHHTGMAVDLTFYRPSEGISIPVASHPNGGWLSEHCAEYGFILRYAENKVEITKTAYEPWHFRFVGKPHAAIIMKTGLCFEEYIGLMKNYTLDTMLLHATEDGTTAEVSVTSLPTDGYVIYYVPASAEATTEIKIPKGFEHYIVSGNNADGFIVTVYVGQ